MSLVDKFRSLPTPMIVMHIGSKALIGLGLGVVFAQHLQGFGGWIILVGIALSIPPIYLLLKK